MQFTPQNHTAQIEVRSAADVELIPEPTEQAIRGIERCPLGFPFVNGLAIDSENVGNFTINSSRSSRQRTLDKSIRAGNATCTKCFDSHWCKPEILGFPHKNKAGGGTNTAERLSQKRFLPQGVTRAAPVKAPANHTPPSPQRSVCFAVWGPRMYQTPL